MKITSLKLANFRCFGPEPVQIDFEKFTSLIGANGAGKSAILHALIRLFGSRQNERSLIRADFHIPPGTDAVTVPEVSLWIEAKLEFPKLSSNPNDPSVPDCFRHMIVAAPGEVPFCRVRLEGTWRRTAQAEGVIDEDLWWLVSAADTPSPSDKQKMSNYDRNRIQVIYVPASRDPSGQLRQAAGSLLHPILRAIRWSENTRASATEAANQIRAAVAAEPGMRSLERAVGEEWKKLQEFAPLRDVRFQPFSPEFETLLRHIEAVFHSGSGNAAQPIERLSDGLRSLFYFSLLGARFDLERSVVGEGEISPFDFEYAKFPTLTIFAIEEPENHLAPQYLARILVLLQRLSELDGAQTLLTSHSPGILSRVEPETVRHLRLDPATGRARIKSLTLPPADAGEVYKYVKEAIRAYPELYFANAVILGEGDSECIVLPRVARASGRMLDQRFVAVVPLGGRHVNHFWRLLEELEIPYVTLLDLDRERQAGGWERIHYAIRELLKFPSKYALASLGITQQELDDMPNANVDDLINLSRWIDALETRGVFFSAPLDLDFSMLMAFPAAYHAATAGSGPRIPGQEPQRLERLAQATNAVLKPEGGDGHTYTNTEKDEFIWYQYLFLGRGKPSTHILALNVLNDAQIRTAMPAVFSRLLNRIVPFDTAS